MKTNNKNKLPKNFSPKTVEISHVGSKGEGTSKLYTEFDYIEKEYVFFIPFSLPSEKIIVQPISKSSEGVRGNILEIINSSIERTEPQCNHFFKCGGCILQHWKFESYNKWKINKLSFPINLISPETEIKSIITSPLKSRRHAKFIAKKTKTELLIGFNEFKNDFISKIDDCIILDQRLTKLTQDLQEPLNKILQVGQKIYIHANLLDFGIDLLIEGFEKLPHKSLFLFNNNLLKKNIIRLSRLMKDKSIDLLFVNEKTSLSMSPYSSYILPPSGSFLQATKNGETTIINSVIHGLKNIQKKIKICELFAGSGSITLPLLSKGYQVTAYEINIDSIKAINLAAKEQGFSNKIDSFSRNLKNNPLTHIELNKFDVIIVDPPRSGAKIQFEKIALSKVSIVISISCNINSFISDAKILLQNNYELKWVQPIDQFLFTPHIELVGLFLLKN